METRTAFIVNPVSACGGTGRQWPSIEAKLRARVAPFDVFFTVRRGHATELTRRALYDGYACVVSVGGDGTHHEVVNGFFDNGVPIAPDARMAILPNGTGSDLARTLGIRTIDEAIEGLAAGRTARIDVGRARYVNFDGVEAAAYFINVADFGIGGAVVERVQGGRRFRRGKLVYFYALIRTLLAYKAPVMRVDIDGEVFDEPLLNVILANGRYYGGGIHVARDARLDSGVFETLLIRRISLWTALRCLPAFYDGTFVELEHIVYRRRGTRITATTPERVIIDLDGEAPGRLPLTVDILPAALNMVAR